MKLSVHLTFNGQCEAAFHFYEKHVGGEIGMMLSYGDSPAAAKTPVEWQDKIIHATLILGGDTFCGVDVLPSDHAPAQGFFVLLHVPNPSEAERVFHALSESGTVKMPLQETFWASRFGVLIDQFGTPWEINCGRG